MRRLTKIVLMAVADAISPMPTPSEEREAQGRARSVEASRDRMAAAARRLLDLLPPPMPGALNGRRIEEAKRELAREVRRAGR